MESKPQDGLKLSSHTRGARAKQPISASRRTRGVEPEKESLFERGEERHSVTTVSKLSETLARFRREGQTNTSDILQAYREDQERNSDADLQELTDALSQEELDEMNAEESGKYDPPPTPRWPRE